MVGVHAVRAESSSIDRLVVEQLAFRWAVVCINIVVSVAAVGLDGEGERRPGRGWSVSCYDVEGALELNQLHLQSGPVDCYCAHGFVHRVVFRTYGHSVCMVLKGIC